MKITANKKGKKNRRCKISVVTKGGLFRKIRERIKVASKEKKWNQKKGWGGEIRLVKLKSHKKNIPTQFIYKSQILDQHAFWSHLLSYYLILVKNFYFV